MAQKLPAPQTVVRLAFQHGVLVLLLMSTLRTVQARSLLPSSLRLRDLASVTPWGRIVAPKLCPCKGLQTSGCPEGFPKPGCLRLSLQCVCRRPFCDSTTLCATGSSCDLDWNKCFSSPRRVGDPCSADSSCGPDLTCSLDTGLCILSVNTPSPSPALAPAPSPIPLLTNRTTLVAAAVTSFADLPLGSACTLTSECSQGLVCNMCPGGNDAMTCRQGSWTLQSSDYDRPYNKVPWLVAHNAYAQNVRPPNSWAYPVFLNQDLSITDQLNYGARGLMLDVYLVNGDVYLCHSYCDFGKIALGTILSELKSWMDANPTEVVTLFLEDYVTGSSPGKLTSAFASAGLSPYLFPSDKMPSDGSDWPTIRAMASIGRLVVWSDASDGDFPWQWDYYVESVCE